MNSVGSLFSGIGGLDEGLRRAGFKHTFLCESDPWRRSILAERFPGVPCYEDVRHVDGRRDKQPDLLCGGFPCQDVSVAGRRAGLAGERSGLFHEFARIVDAVQPRWVLVENVPGLLSSNGGRDFGVVLGTLADIGYGVGWRVLDSRFFGVPQRRRRVFIVGALADGDPAGAARRAGQVLAVGSRCPGHPSSRSEAEQDVAVASLGGLGTGGPDDNDAQGGRLVSRSLNTKQGHRYDGDSDEFVVADTVRSHPRPGSNSIGNLTYNWQSGGDVRLSVREGYTDALSKSQVPAVGVRRLTPTECERLQGFPDGWTLPGPDSRRYAALGDAVTVPVAEWLGRRILTSEVT